MKRGATLFLSLAIVLLFSCKEESPKPPMILSQELYSGIYEAFRGEFVGYDSNRIAIEDTFFYKLVNDTLLLKIREDSILLSGSNVNYRFANSGDVDSIHVKESFSAAHYNSYGYIRDSDSLNSFHFSTGGFTASFIGKKL